MKKKPIVIYFVFFFTYILLYTISLIINSQFAISLTKPGASLLAFVAIAYFTKSISEQKGPIQIIRFAMLVWFLVDFFSAVGEISCLSAGEHLGDIYNLELIAYIIPRTITVFAAIKLYCTIIPKANKFQIFADLLTAVTCICTTLWFVFFKGKTPVIFDENVEKLVQLDVLAFGTLIYLLISLLGLGFLLLSWFYLQKMRLSLGQRMILLGTALILGLDLLQALHSKIFTSSLLTDILYKAGILLIAAGGPHYSAAQWFTITPKSNAMQGTGFNGLYFFTYPLLVIITVGFERSILLFLLIIAFYFVSCLLVKQITLTNRLLDSEKEYNEKLKLYSNVLEQSTLSIVITDMDGNIQYVNPYFSKTTGYTFEEALGKNPRILKSDKTSPAVYDELWGNLTQGKIWHGNFVNLTKAKEEFEERAIIIPIKDENDITTHYVAIKENISESIKMQNQITNQNYFTAQLMDALPIPVFYTSKDDIFLGANTECIKIYGISSDDLKGRSLSSAEWMSDEKYQVFLEMKKEATIAKRSSTRQIKRKLSDGKEHDALYSISAFYQYDGSLGGYLGVMTDITELKQKEIELENALKLANEATVAKSQFLANMSHEIRTPMNAIIGMAYLTLKTSLNEKQSNYISKIHGAATSLLGIINDILDFSKIESGRLELETAEFNLDTAIADSVALLTQRAFEKRLEFLYHLPFDIPQKLLGDRLRLGQIITNLVSNAVKFTDKGEIAIDVKALQKDGERIQLQFSVRDTGIGISPEDKEKLFEAFI